MEKRIISHGRFYDAFDENLTRYGSVKAAYEATENEYEAVQGERRYSSYYSFVNCRYSKRKRNKRRY